MSHLLSVLCPDLPSSAPENLHAINSPPLLPTLSLAERRLGKRTLAVSTDNIPRAVLFNAGSGVHVGQLHAKPARAQP